VLDALRLIEVDFAQGSSSAGRRKLA